MKEIIRQNAKKMEQKLEHKRTMEKMYYKNKENPDEQFSFSGKVYA
jgi:hypothetical protein